MRANCLPRLPTCSRYEYKLLTSTWKKKVASEEKAGNKLEAEIARGRVVLYDSLQVRLGGGVMW